MYLIGLLGCMFIYIKDKYLIQWIKFRIVRIVVF